MAFSGFTIFFDGKRIPSHVVRLSEVDDSYRTATIRVFFPKDYPNAEVPKRIDVDQYHNGLLTRRFAYVSGKDVMRRADHKKWDEKEAEHVAELNDFGD